MKKLIGGGCCEFRGGCGEGCDGGCCGGDDQDDEE